MTVENYTPRRFTEESVAAYDDEGWQIMTCFAHPSKRWVMKEPNVQRISRNPQLMYLGDLDDGRPACPFQSMDDEGKRAQEAIGFGFECACPLRLLRKVEG